MARSCAPSIRRRPRAARRVCFARNRVIPRAGTPLAGPVPHGEPGQAGRLPGARFQRRAGGRAGAAGGRQERVRAHQPAPRRAGRGLFRAGCALSVLRCGVAPCGCCDARVAHAPLPAACGGAAAWGGLPCASGCDRTCGGIQATAFPAPRARGATPCRTTLCAVRELVSACRAAARRTRQPACALLCLEPLAWLLRPLRQRRPGSASAPVRCPPRVAGAWRL